MLPRSLKKYHLIDVGKCSATGLGGFGNRKLFPTLGYVIERYPTQRPGLRAKENQSKSGKDRNNLIGVAARRRCQGRGHTGTAPRQASRQQTRVSSGGRVARWSVPSGAPLLQNGTRWDML